MLTLSPSFHGTETALSSILFQLSVIADGSQALRDRQEASCCEVQHLISRFTTLLRAPQLDTNLKEQSLKQAVSKKYKKLLVLLLPVLIISSACFLSYTPCILGGGQELHRSQLVLPFMWLCWVCCAAIGFFLFNYTIGIISQHVTIHVGPLGAGALLRGRQAGVALIGAYK